MRRRRKGAGIRESAIAAVVGIVAARLGAVAAADPPARIVVGPNILVSRDGDFPHVELMVAANPRNAKNLVGAAITEARPKGGRACRAYSSHDGGNSWSPSEFREQIEYGGGDPQAAFTPRGTALFVALASVPDEKGRTRGGLHVYRSEDGGATWQRPTDLGYSYDHEQIAVDHTLGRYAGRVYLGVLYDYPVYRVGVFRSEDDGRTFIGPVEAANGGGTIGVNDVNLMVLSDGTLVVPYADFEFLPEKRSYHGTTPSTTWLVTSSDGGVSFSKPKKVVTMTWDQDDPGSGGFAALAADSRSARYRDRIYAAWTDRIGGRPRLLFSRSADRGGRWSAPAPVDSRAPDSARQFQPVVAVNADGVVAVTWFDTRDSADGKRYHQYFAASLDGGETFLPSVRVSSALSDPEGPGNSVLKPDAFRYKQSLYISSLSAASRWASGGDYMGLTADRDGAFHPFWTDARTGTFQIYTARVEVVRDAGRATGEGSAPPANASARNGEPAARVEQEINDKVELVFDPTRYDAASKEIEYPIRLRNVSRGRIYPPIRLEVLAFGFEDFASEERKREDAKNAPAVLDAANGKTGVGAVVEFRDALGNLEALEPGAQTGPVPLRLKLVDPKNTPQIRIRLTAFVQGER